MKIALVHDWLVTLGGAEKVLLSMANVYQADIFTLLMDQNKNMKALFKDQKIHTSWIQKLPFAKRFYRSYLPFFPFAIEQFDLSHYDLILSSSHAVAKGVITNAEQLHICYCHTPMRYAWDLYHFYLKEAKLKRGLRAFLAKGFLHYLRLWDRLAAERVDAYIANSKFVAKRILKIYGKEAEVIYPPVNVEEDFLPAQKEDYYLTASRLVPYKKIDLIVETFARLPDKKLLVIGEGPDRKKILAKATKNIAYLGYQEDAVLKEKMKKARAFIFAAVEDFGILPVEAQGCGTPVIAYGKGGILETVVENQTGIFFSDQTEDSLRKGIEIFEAREKEFDPKKIHAHAFTFHEKHFQKKFKEFVEKKYADHCSSWR